MKLHYHNQDNEHIISITFKVSLYSSFLMFSVLKTIVSYIDWGLFNLGYFRWQHKSGLCFSTFLQKQKLIFCYIFLVLSLLIDLGIIICTLSQCISNQQKLNSGKMQNLYCALHLCYYYIYICYKPNIIVLISASYSLMHSKNLRKVKNILCNLIFTHIF